MDLARFSLAQDRPSPGSSVYVEALAELRRGRKTTHWMWFVFPQLAGLGRSAMAQTYALGSLAEARTYLADPVLGARLRECARALLDLDGSDPEPVLGGIDALKLRSSMTLFQHAAPGEPVFSAVLQKYFRGESDPETDRRLAGVGPAPG